MLQNYKTEQPDQAKQSAKRQYDLMSGQTLDTINALLSRGITRISAMIRHSDRNYTTDPRLEPFMGLTPEGKSYAYDMGKSFPDQVVPQLFSSHFGRCIETAYLIDKGVTHARKVELGHNVPEDLLAPFYIRKIETALKIMETQGSKTFIRNWFDKNLPEGVMEDPHATADMLVRYMVEKLENCQAGTLPLCVTHDWNIFPIREFKLDLPHEDAGDVGYLDGVVFYKEGDQYFVMSHQSAPVVLGL